MVLEAGCRHGQAVAVYSQGRSGGVAGVVSRIMAGAKIIVNFKTYESAHAGAAESLARAMLVVDSETDAAEMIAVVSAFDLSAVVAAAPGLQVWTQHLDPVGFGSNTGWLHPETAIARGAVGTLIYHAEHKV